MRLPDVPVLHVVLRGDFIAEGVARKPGEVLDTKGWRNVRPLVNTRYLGEVPASIDYPRTIDGRRWVDEKTAAQHDMTITDQDRVLYGTLNDPPVLPATQLPVTSEQSGGGGDSLSHPASVASTPAPDSSSDSAPRRRGRPPKAATFAAVRSA